MDGAKEMVPLSSTVRIGEFELLATRNAVPLVDPELVIESRPCGLVVPTPSLLFELSQKRPELVARANDPFPNVR